jgi:hypothetical protein
MPSLQRFEGCSQLPGDATTGIRRAVAPTLVDHPMTAEAKFSVHRDPVWRDRADFIINAKLPEEGRYEQLWARKITDDTFELCCVPFFLYGFALGDILQTCDMDGRNYVVNGVVTHSGRHVFRAHFPHPSAALTEIVERRLIEIGAEIEWSSATLVAIDARDRTIAEQIVDFLDERAEHGELLYETGQSA